MIHPRMIMSPGLPQNQKILSCSQCLSSIILSLIAIFIISSISSVGVYHVYYIVDDDTFTQFYQQPQPGHHWKPCTSKKFYTDVNERII